ncbi:MAG: hypothetical protein RLW62_20490, partial [Gammaproteobacteria bacterium]
MIFKILDRILGALPGRRAAPARETAAHADGLLQLPLHGVTYRFTNLADLDFALSARITVPPQRMQTLYASSIPALEADSIKLRTLELQLSGILEDLDLHGIPVARSLLRTGIGMISKDNGWRDIFAVILTNADPGPGFARLALVRYLAFLAERRDVLDALLTLKRASAARAAAALDDGAAAATIGGLPAAPVPGAASRAAGLARLPRGRAVVLELAAGREVEITLARHRFAIAHGSDWTLVTADGQRFLLQPGLNSVGRSRGSTVAVDGALRNV